MNTTLVGMFDTQAAAMNARSQLLSAGIAESAVSMTGDDGGMPAASSSSATAATRAPGSLDDDAPGPIARFFDNLFGDDDKPGSTDPYADTYREAFRRGAYGVTVHATSVAELDRAQAVLNEAGAIDIDTRAASWRQEGWKGGDDLLATADTRDTGTAQTLTELEEQLKVGKRTVTKGGVRVFSRIIEVPVEESVTLREEHADVQRRAVDRPATPADLDAFKEGSIEVRETSEEAVVSKSARVVGEVEIRKSATEREETVRDTVRKTKVEVEQLGADDSRPGESVDAERRTMAYADAGAGAGAGADADRGLTGGTANRDPLTGELGAHPVGTGVGAAAGGIAAGAAVGSVAGPVGTAVGAAAGAIAGGLAGKGVAEEIDPTRPKTPPKI